MSKVIVNNSQRIKERLDYGQTLLLEFKWGTSKARDTYGYNICSCYIDGEKVGSCNGGGYDMQGTSFAKFLNNAFQEELMNLNESEFYGLNVYDDHVYCDGGCGLNCVIRIFEAIGHKAEYHWDKKNGTYYLISKK